MQQDKELYYSAYVSGVKKFFRQLLKSSKQAQRIEKHIDNSDTKRADVRRIFIKHTKDQPLGY